MSARWLALWARGLRSEPGRGIAVAALILVTVLIAASVPRLLSRTSNDALHAEISAAPSTVTRPGAGPGRPDRRPATAARSTW